MLTLARALCRKPRLLLADELSLGLAPLIVERLLQAVQSAAHGERHRRGHRRAARAQGAEVRRPRARALARPRAHGAQRRGGARPARRTSRRTTSRARRSRTRRAPPAAARRSRPERRGGDPGSRRAASVGGEDVHRHGGGVLVEPAAAVLGERDAGAGDLAVAGLAAQLPRGLAHLRDAGGADRVALAQQAAARVDGQVAVQAGAARVEQLRAAAGRREAELLVDDQLGGRAGVVDLGAVEVVGAEARLLVGRPRGPARRARARVATCRGGCPRRRRRRGCAGPTRRGGRPRARRRARPRPRRRRSASTSAA